ncbi:serine/threonine-protein phosphatase 6 regulatory ankyrin repeat subunit A [Patella vulgata]|uniref:serine/threonine-protein phosphatase 6 regulatory ankyrin repeat subunit A n=1 Tax=Patella vulgata TaxID=6465 RepID=UPI0021801846|nr:serine/threonine-protein phosphatase 6 regulatory ankyrin repeat subunit A [Patella vulgata]XP_050403526.1 serine/threonine-protein phosphatase 6 regulatory ankyrin repeat subunit A [Patella vulgata]
MPSKLYHCVLDRSMGEIIETIALTDKLQTLIIAAKEGYYNVVIYLLEYGVDKHYVDSRQNNLINILLDTYDTTCGHDLLLQCVVKLVESGVDANKLNEYEETPIYVATIKGLYDVVIYLLEQGVDVHNIDRVENNLIHTFLYRYDITLSHYLLLDCVVKLLESGVDVNQVNTYKETPIYIAATKGLFDVVICLLERGAGVHYVDSHQNNLIHTLLDIYDNTCRHDLLLKCIVTLVETGVDANQLNEYEEAPISIAASKGLYDVVIYLLERGCYVLYLDSHKNNLIHTLLYRHEIYDNTERSDLLLQCVVTLVETGVDVNQVNEDTETPILIAARKGLYDVVIYLLESGVDVHCVVSHENNLIHTLLDIYDNTRRHDLLLQCVVTLVETGVDVNQVNENKETPILTAARKGLYELVIHLLGNGADAHYVVSHQHNLIHTLLETYDNTRGHDLLLQCVVKLVESGVDANQLNEYKEAPISIAASKGLYNVVIYLLEQGVDVHNVDRFENNLIHTFLYRPDITCSHDLSLDYVVKLVESGVDANQVNEYKEAPISIAASEGLCDVVLYLLEQGVGVHYVDRHKNNLIHKLLYSHDIFDNTGRSDLLLKCVVKLVETGVDVNQVNEDNETPILIAAWKGLYDVVIHLLENGVDVHYVVSHEIYLIHTLLDIYDNTCRHDLLLPCVVNLVETGVDVNQVNENKETPILIAARKGLYELVIYLLGNGVDVHYVVSHQNNLIHTLLGTYTKTCRYDLLLDCVVKLVESGVDANQMNKYKESPIFKAASEGLFDVVIYLLQHGVDVQYVDTHQNNLMHTLLYRHDIHYIKGGRDLLLQCVDNMVHAGVDVNHVNRNKETPILIAARKGLNDVALCLLERGVDVHYVDGFKCNILHYAVGSMYSNMNDTEQCVQLVSTLIKTGLDINQPNYKGNTPLFYVGINKHCSQKTLPYYLGKLYGKKMKWKIGHDIHVQLQCKLIDVLLEAGCIANHQNTEGLSALMHHIKHQADISILKLLIPSSDLSLTDNNGDTALGYCVQYHMINSTAVFTLLVDSGSDMMSRNARVKLVHKILSCKRLGVFNYYIGLKLIANGVTVEGENMLHLLASVNYDYSLRTFKWLLKNELDINHPCSKTNTPTMIAALLLNSEYLKLFTRHQRLEINAQNNQGHTALHLCIIGFTMVKDGLSNRQIQDVVNNYCSQIYPKYMLCIDSLLAVDGIDVNIQDTKGRTSLMMAAMKNDRVLTRKLLQAGAMVNVLDYAGRSALQYLNIYKSVVDLTCFKLLVSNGSTGLLNLPCIDGNTIIQTVLSFPFFWEPYRVARFIRYLVAENCCLQTLVTSSVESSYNQIDLTELSIRERGKLRELLYLSGAREEEVMTTLNFDEEDKGCDVKDTIRSPGREDFIRFCSKIEVSSLCRRIVRQNLGLGIKEKVKNLELPSKFHGFLQLKDILDPEDYNIDNIDDGCNDFDDDDDYDGYDIDSDRDDDYSQYKYQYVTLNTDDELRQDFLKTVMFPNGDSGLNIYVDHHA